MKVSTEEQNEKRLGAGDFFHRLCGENGNHVEERGNVCWPLLACFLTLLSQNTRASMTVGHPDNTVLCRDAAADSLEESLKSLPRQIVSYFYHFQKYCRLEEEGGSPLWGKTKVQRREMADNDVLGASWTEGHG